MAQQSWLQRIWKSPSGLAAQEARRVLPFFIMLTLAMMMMYGWSVTELPTVRSSPGTVVMFTLLMIAHVVLYWLSPRWAGRRPHTLIYLVAQGALTFTLTMIIRNIGLTFGLYAALIGGTVGVLGRTRWTVLAVLIELGLSAISFVLIAGASSLGIWALTSGPIVVFVIVYVVMYLREVEAHGQAQILLQELETAHRQLSEYAAQVEDLTLANERQRMARELHDTLSQGLAGLVLQLEAIDSQLSRNNTAKAQSITQQAMERARTTLADARRAIDDLRSGAVTEVDLETAVRQEADRFTAATGLPCDLAISLPLLLAEAVRENTLRVVAEALSNIARYAQAQHVRVNIRPIDHTLDIEVHDDGVGFDPAQISAGHYGLIGLRERVRLCNGTLAIDSAPGQGTTLKVQLPLVVGS